MKSFNHKCIKVCSSMKVSLLYKSIIYELIIVLFHLQMMSILYISLTALSAVLQEVVSVTVSTIQYSNDYNINYILLYNEFNINNNYYYYIYYYKNVFAHKFYYYPSTFS